jgi:probable HAF family extracellular repeat protein
MTIGKLLARLFPLLAQNARNGAAGILLALVSLSFLPAAAQSYRVTDLGTLGGKNSTAYGVNDLGQVAGTSVDEQGAQHAFLWSALTGMRDLGFLAGVSTLRQGTA